MANKNKSSGKLVGIRFLEEEYEILKSKADLNKMNISQYIKERLFVDDVIIEKNSPQLQILKTVSYCAGVLSKMADIQFCSKQDKEDVREAINEISLANGIDIKK